MIMGVSRHTEFQQFARSMECWKLLFHVKILSPILV